MEIIHVNEQIQELDTLIHQLIKDWPALQEYLLLEDIYTASSQTANPGRKEIAVAIVDKFTEAPSLKEYLEYKVLGGYEFKFKDGNQVKYFNYKMFNVSRWILVDFLNYHLNQYQGDKSEFLEKIESTYNLYGGTNTTLDDDIKFRKEAIAEWLERAFAKVASNKKDELSSKVNKYGIEWADTDTNFMEFVYALIESNAIKYRKKQDVVKAFSEFFGFDIKNPDQTLQAIKRRNNDNETIFLDKLKTAFSNYLKKS